MAKKIQRSTVNHSEFLQLFQYISKNKEWVADHTINDILEDCEKQFKREFSQQTIKKILKEGDFDFKKSTNTTGGIIGVLNGKMENLQKSFDEQQQQLINTQAEINDLKSKVRELELKTNMTSSNKRPVRR